MGICAYVCAMHVMSTHVQYTKWTHKYAFKLHTRNRDTQATYTAGPSGMRHVSKKFIW